MGICNMCGHVSISGRCINCYHLLPGPVGCSVKSYGWNWITKNLGPFCNSCFKELDKYNKRANKAESQVQTTDGAKARTLLKSWLAEDVNTTEGKQIMDEDKPRNDLSYLDALHVIQSGVAKELDLVGSEIQNRHNKHLRVGINSGMINDAALVRLLIKKGLFTIEEYLEELRLEANRELDLYEDKLSRVYKTKITLR